MFSRKQRHNSVAQTLGKYLSRRASVPCTAYLCRCKNWPSV